MTIHAFCDASLSAYACCIYVGSLGKKHSLVYARHHNTPLKVPQTIPRNELNGMVLCIETVDIVLEVLQQYNPQVHLWCDSQVALAWVQGVRHYEKWTPYVRNRVKKIAGSRYPVSSWRYVDTEQNPADLLTRPWKGKTTKTIYNCLDDFWLHGPAFIRQNTCVWPKVRAFTTCSKTKPKAKLPDMTLNSQRELLAIFERCKSFDLIVKSIGIMLRCKDGKTRERGTITPKEYERAFLTLVRLTQKCYSHRNTILWKKMTVRW